MVIIVVMVVMEEDEDEDKSHAVLAMEILQRWCGRFRFASLVKCVE
jgi:hypothetical protein